MKCISSTAFFLFIIASCCFGLGRSFANPSSLRQQHCKSQCSSHDKAPRALQKPVCNLFWLVEEEPLDCIDDIWEWIPDRISEARWYMNCRFVTRTHCLTAHPRDIKRGDWEDVGWRFLPCLFNALVDFVDIELAGFHCICDDEASKKYKYPWWNQWYFNWRSEEAGMEYIAWKKTLTESYKQQADVAKEIEILYKWWKYERPQRPDPYEEDTDIRFKLEKAYEEEDEEMMIRLIKVRESLWT